MGLLIFNIILGLFYIGIGYAVKAYPNLIAGYNSMSEEEKKNVDIVGASSMMRNVFIIAGIASILVAVVFYVFRGGDPNSILITGGLIPVLVCVFSFTMGRKYNKNKKKW